MRSLPMPVMAISVKLLPLIKLWYLRPGSSIPRPYEGKGSAVGHCDRSCKKRENKKTKKTSLLLNWKGKFHEIVHKILHYATTEYGNLFIFGLQSSVIWLWELPHLQKNIQTREDSTPLCLSGLIKVGKQLATLFC